MPFTFETLGLPGLVLARPRVFEDDRGLFLETFRRDEFERAGIAGDWVQDNHVRTLRRGIVRGLHLQRDPHAQAKLVRCVRGRVFDVAVDLRPGSASFGRHATLELSEENRLVLFVPRGFAHGYQALEDGCEVLYKVDAPYAPAAESGLRWDDPEVAVAWPIRDAELNARDRSLPTLREVRAGAR